MIHILKLILILGLFGSTAVANETLGECEGVFTGVLNSHDDNGGITLQPNVDIFGTIDHKVTTKSLTAQPAAECDGADCLKTDTIVDKFDFDVLHGDGSDGGVNLKGNNNQISINESKNYTSFSTNSHRTVTINGKNRGVVVGKDFNDALLKIWLGAKPVTKSLRNDLLGMSQNN